MQLKEFISQQTAATLTLGQWPPNSADSANIASRKQSGLYLKALAHGIDQVLEGYRQQIVRVEKKVENSLQYRMFNTVSDLINAPLKINYQPWVAHN